MNNAPAVGIELSVVLAAAHSRAGLEACLTSLKDQVSGGEIDVIVACNCCEGAGRSIEEAFPFVRLIEAPPGTTVPELRTLGIQAATGRIVALLEDNSIVAPTWCRAIRRAHAAPKRSSAELWNETARIGPSIGPCISMSMGNTCFPA